MFTYILLLISHWEQEGGCSGGDGYDTLYWVAIRVPMKIAHEYVYMFVGEEDEYIDISDLDLDDVNRLWDSLLRHLRTEAETHDIDLPEYLFNTVMGFCTTDSVDGEIELCVIQNKGWSCCSGWTRYLHASEFVAEPSEYDENTYDMTTTSPPDFDFDGDEDTWDIKVLDSYSPSVEFTFNTPFFQKVALSVAVPAPEAAVDGALVAVAAPVVAASASVATVAAPAPSSSDDDEDDDV